MKKRLKKEKCGRNEEKWKREGGKWEKNEKGKEKMSNVRGKGLKEAEDPHPEKFPCYAPDHNITKPVQFEGF